MRRLSVVALSALLGLTIALPAAAQWKWRDKTGQIQYSDLPPPPGVSEQDILQRPLQAQQRRVSVVSGASAPASAASGIKGVDPELEVRRRKAEQDQAAKQKADEERVAAAKADNCNRAKSHMRSLDDGIRIVRNNDKGEREYLDDKQRGEEVRRTREIIASDCK